MRTGLGQLIEAGVDPHYNRPTLFSIPRVNVVASDEGFSVEVLGRTGLQYREGTRSLFVDSEILMGPSGLVVFADSIKEWENPPKEIVFPEEKRRILRNIRDAFRFQGFEIQILDPESAG